MQYTIESPVDTALIARTNNKHTVSARWARDGIHVRLWERGTPRVLVGERIVHDYQLAVSLVHSVATLVADEEMQLAKRMLRLIP